MPAGRRLTGDRGGTQEDVRRHNLAVLLEHLHLSGPLSRADLTARMGLNRSTIGALVAELSGLGAVVEGHPSGAQPGAGRPSLVVRPAGENLQVLAAEVAVDHVVVALVGLGGAVVARRHRRLGRVRGPGAVAGLLARLVDSLLADPAAGRRVVALGVSVPGVVRHSDGLVHFAPNLGWVDQPFGEVLAAAVPGFAASVGNDADLGVLAEHRRGAAVGYDDVVFLAGEVGVGGGLIVGGQPVQGAGGYAGELGHLPIRSDGHQCRCGARGCWETEIGSPAIGRALGLVDASSEDLVDAIRAAARTDPQALAEVGRYLGQGLAAVVNVLNPRLVILGGLLREVYPAVGEQVLGALRARALSAAAAQVELAVPSLGGDSVLVGASELAWQSVLADPVTALALPTGRVVPRHAATQDRMRPTARGGAVSVGRSTVEG